MRNKFLNIEEGDEYCDYHRSQTIQDVTMDDNFKFKLKGFGKTVYTCKICGYVCTHDTSIKKTLL